jgi:uncharacterized coiled-coil DUF342 family protein
MSHSAIDEILEFADAVAKARTLANQATSFHQACQESKSRLAQLAAEEDKAKKNLLQAKDQAKKTIEEAELAAAEIIKTANVKTKESWERIERESKSRIEKLGVEITELTDQKYDLEQQIKDLYTARDVLEGRVDTLNQQLDKIRSALAQSE